MLTPQESPPVPDNRDWTETMTWRTFTIMGTCNALFLGDAMIIIVLADADSYEYWEYASSIALFQLVAFTIITFLIVFIYRPPSGSIEEITGPNCRQFENAMYHRDSIIQTYQIPTNHAMQTAQGDFPLQGLGCVVLNMRPNSNSEPTDARKLSGLKVD